jgi:uncharacterized membrane protein
MLSKIIQFSRNIALSLIFIFLTFALLDALWLGWIATDWYQHYMTNMLRTEIITWPWLVFYLMYGCVTFVLCVVPNREKSALYAFIDGGLLGLASYGTYNLTTYSLLSGFTIELMMVDWVWGICITSLSAMAGWYGFQRHYTPPDNPLHE